MKPLHRWLTLGAALVLLNLLSFCSHLPPIHPPGARIIYAQTLPVLLKAQWLPNAATDFVVQYQVKADGGTAQIVNAASCTTTLCTSNTLTFPNYGPHTVTETACNLMISTEPTSLRCGPVTTLPFILAPLPGASAGLNVVPSP